MKLRSGIVVSESTKKGSPEPIVQSENYKSGDTDPSGKTRRSLVMLRAGLLLIIVWLVVLPVVVKVYPFILTEIVFLQKLRWPPFINLTNPEEFRLNFTRNFRIQSDNGVSLGVWHVLPLSLHNSDIKDFDNSLHKDIPVVLYLHGNAGTRAAWHRVQLYKKLAMMDFHVITLDYRGYADSTGYPSEEGVVRDSLRVYDYIRSINSSVTIYVWGHSLGSAIATRVTKHLCQSNLPVKGMILESPFNNLLEAAQHHPVSWLYKPMPWFEWMFVEGLDHINISFTTDKNIADVTVPTIILHAEDDGIVPYELGKQLYQAALDRKQQGSVEFVTFEGKHGYGHKHIHKSPLLPQVIKKFSGKSI